LLLLLREGDERDVGGRRKGERGRERSEGIVGSEGTYEERRGEKLVTGYRSTSGNRFKSEKR
jgi:hypothetical protein